MFGWEFPPHISGGLGTACYGLTRGLTGLKGVEVLFVVPRAFGDENTDDLQLIGANHVPVVRKEVYFNGEGQSFDSFQVQSEIIPYVGEEEFWKLKSKIQTGNNNFVETDENNNIRFSGGYGPDLFREIFNYALVAGIIAAENRFDIIHAHDWLAYPAGIRAREVSGKPLVIHEQNSVAGLTNKAMAKLANRVLAAFPYALKDHLRSEENSELMTGFNIDTTSKHMPSFIAARLYEKVSYWK